jgi:DNA invertase Pin-like site-specific DNA recombinase
MAYKKLDAENKLTIINLFKPGKLTLAEIAKLTGYSTNTVGKVISENIYNQSKKNKLERFLKINQ